MNIFLWILQVLLGAMFVMHSYILGVRYEQMKTQQGMSYMGDLNPRLRTFIALSELLGGLGLILPGLTGILPFLTGWAASGIALVMLLAAVFHFTRRENPNIIFNLVLFALAAFLAYGRLVIAPL